MIVAPSPQVPKSPSPQIPKSLGLKQQLLTEQLLFETYYMITKKT